MFAEVLYLYLISHQYLFLLSGKTDLASAIPPPNPELSVTQLPRRVRYFMLAPWTAAASRRCRRIVPLRVEEFRGKCLGVWRAGAGPPRETSLRSLSNRPLLSALSLRRLASLLTRAKVRPLSQF